MLDNLSKFKSVVVPVAAVVLLCGCKDESVAQTTTPAPVDLTQAEDLFAQPIKANPLTTDPEAVIIRVNGEEIKRKEIQQVMQQALARFGGQVDPQQLAGIQAQMEGEIKQQLVAQKLMNAAVKAANIDITAEEIEKAIEEVKKNIPEGKTLEEALSATGMTVDKLKEELKTQLATNKFMEEKVKDVADATEEEAKEFYDANPDQFKKPENVSASHILITVEKTASEEVKAEKKAELEKVRADIIAGTITFEDAAKAHSGCPSKEQGGSLGNFGRKQMVPEFETAAFSQEIGEVGDVIETQFGYHIVKVDERKAEEVVSFEEAKEQLTQYLSTTKKREVAQSFMKGLLDSATIEYVE